MFQGNWKCSKCSAGITELPFEPKGEKGLVCRTCYAKQKDGEKSDSVASDELKTSEEAPDVSEMSETAGVAGEQPQAPDFEEMPASTGERPKFEGDWKCAGCGGAITSLPFEPRSTENLKCLDCFKNSKAN